jgi:hypothetical protein
MKMGKHTVTGLLKTGIGQLEQMSIARQWLGICMLSTADTHATTVVLLEMVSSVWSMPNLYTKD